MLDTFQGLPVHALIVHATVVVVPLAALLVALAAVHPGFRGWIGWLAPATAVASVVLVQLTAMSGRQFYDRLKRVGAISPDIQHHKNLAGVLIWFVIALAVVAVAGYLLHRKEGVSRLVLGVVTVLAVASAGAVAVDVALIGHAGAKASWKSIVDGTNQAR